MAHDAQTAVASGTPLRPYKVKEFADLADLSLNAVYQMIARGQLPAVRLGGAIRLPREKCDRILRGEAA
jgi:excisionase family DNA binding protein